MNCSSTLQRLMSDVWPVDVGRPALLPFPTHCVSRPKKDWKYWRKVLMVGQVIRAVKELPPTPSHPLFFPFLTQLSSSPMQTGTQLSFYFFVRNQIKSTEFFFH